MRDANTPTLLRQSLFEGAAALQGPLNDALKSIQERLSRLEQAQGIVLLGPKRIQLPVDLVTSNASVVDFQLPSNFTPKAVFLVALEGADVASIDVGITPAAITYEITNNLVRVTRITTTTPTKDVLLLTLGAIRG